MKKRIAVILAVVLLVCVAAGATIAWLTDTTEVVKNTFTTSNIEVELKETDPEGDDDATNNAYKMIPGWTIDKDPKAKITSGSEYGYLFIEVEKSANFDTYMDYAIHSDWTALTGVEGVYYIEIDLAEEINKDYKILGAGSKEYDGVTYTWADDQVLVKPTVTKEMMDNIKTEDDKPTLTFQAYAAQLMKNNNDEFTAAEAWAIAKPANS